MTLQTATNQEPFYRFSVAPMLDWTDRHFRYFMRGITKHSLLYTEMITTGALLYGDAARYLAYNEAEHPLALQLGGGVPSELAQCSKMAERLGYDEVNLNVGCPSDRVQNNLIGACLMARPALVAECFKAMQDAVSIPVTIKHRIGIDGRESYEELVDFVGQSVEAGCKRFIVHARIAILKGLSPKQNREVPPLRYDICERLKKDFPDTLFVLNGGIETLSQAQKHLECFDGVMVGRSAYHNCYEWAQVDQLIYGDDYPVISRLDAFLRMQPYIEQHIAEGGIVQHISRHLLGIAQGFAGSRRIRQLLSTDIHKIPTKEVFDQVINHLQIADINT